jgi:hypothetical protein
VFTQYGWLDRSNTCGIARHGADPNFPGDPAIRYGYTRCGEIKAGVMLVFHVLPRTIVDPYFGFDAGLHITNAKYRSFNPTTGEATTGSDTQASFQPGLQLGVDAHPTPALGAGVFAEGGPDIGEEGKPSENDNNSNNNGCFTGPGGNQICNNTCSNGSCNSEAHVGSHFVLGVRVAYTFP